ncbi:pentapeptide repeat-containing protein [Thermocoleostomius sinensis]|uniref:Pentapeptide repeat-containing protein n=1 Tax=Thermocoleostomius sinensis A174 TaxID=2016057 RepID=A0A9E8Z8B6_9CYAN|nr:pentapeptide repeat-containing protein [Thermocoleostomius sinensis]WAL58161.1 pentapeptide repeat-containing protein [Thermocoleostomius sinensis A174]
MPLSLKLKNSRSWFGSRHGRWGRRRTFGLALVGCLTTGLTVWSITKLFSWLAILWVLVLANRDQWGHILAELTIPILEITTAVSLVLLVIWSIQVRRAEQLSNEYAQAIEQLHDCKLENRLEGVHALGRIAKVRQKEHITVTRTLAAFVQSRSPLSREVMLPTLPSEMQILATDIQCALAIIGQVYPLRVNSMLWQRWQLPVSSVFLAFWQCCASSNQARINLGLTNLCKLRLHNAHLQSADLYKVSLQAANLYRANLQQANLQAANLRQANLYRANLREAALQAAQLQQAFLPEANLQQANLYRANLQQAELQRANLQQAGLQDVNLQDANLQGANLHGAFLPDVNLQDANLQGANLHGAFLHGAFLHGATFHAANLHHANLHKAIGLTDQQLQQMKLCQTVLPDGTISDRDCLFVVKTDLS